MVQWSRCQMNTPIKLGTVCLVALTLELTFSKLIISRWTSRCERARTSRTRRHDGDVLSRIVKLDSQKLFGTTRSQISRAVASAQTTYLSWNARPREWHANTLRNARGEPPAARRLLTRALACTHVTIPASLQVPQEKRVRIRARDLSARQPALRLRGRFKFTRRRSNPAFSRPARTRFRALIRVS